MDVWIAPTITGVFGVLVVIAGAIIARRNLRTGAREARTPDVDESWREAERQRYARGLFEELFYVVRGGFRSYVRRAQEGGALELTPQEKAAHDVSAPRPEDFTLNP